MTIDEISIYYLGFLLLHWTVGHPEVDVMLLNVLHWFEIYHYLIFGNVF